MSVSAGLKMIVKKSKNNCRATGANSVHAYVTHGVLSGEAVKRVTDSPLESLVITDTIEPTQAVKEARNIRVVSVAELVGESILRISEERSVTSLFY